jgi:2-dehydro-3-deoxygluconokinase
MLRLSPPRGEQLRHSGYFDVTVGGAESNVAVALASLGTPSRWVGALPSNALGQRIAADLHGAGVDTSHVVWRDEGRVGLYFLEPPVAPRPADIVYDRANSAMTTMSDRDLSDKIFDQATYVVVSGITAALRPHGAALASAFLARAATQRCRRVVDINYRSQLWRPAEATATLRELAAQADLLFCSAADARTLFDIEAMEIDLALALRDQVATEAELVVVSLGPRGAIAYSAANGALQVPGLTVEALDAVGAGDALVAGVIDSEIAGQSSTEAVQAGVTLAALACTVRGDHAKFSRATLQATLAGITGKGRR